MAFDLTITLDATAVSTINAAGQAITLALSVTALAMSQSQSASQALLPLAWLVFAPLETNTVSWNPDDQLYATTTPLVMGNPVVPNSVTTATPGIVLGSVYTFSGGVFTAQTGTGSDYIVCNEEQGDFSFGLLVTATVNDVNTSGPVNALPVLFNEEGYFAPPASVFIFLSSASANGTVLPTIPTSALELSLASGSLTASICFNDTTNTFFLC